MSAGLKSYIDYMGRTRVIVVLFLLYIIFQLSITSIVSPLGSDMLKIQITMSEDTFRNIIRSWEKNNLLAIYIRHFYLDYFFPLIYSFLLSALISRGIIQKGLDKKFNIIVLMPFLAGIMDCIENSMHLYLISNPAKITGVTVLFSGVCSNMKWAVIFLCIIGLLMLFVTRSQKLREL